jgi:hypothetical protein
LGYAYVVCSISIQSTDQTQQLYSRGSTCS